MRSIRQPQSLRGRTTTFGLRKATLACILAAAVSAAPLTLAAHTLDAVPMNRSSTSTDKVGWGVLISDAGHIITSHHVVEGCRSARVEHSNGSSTIAFVMGVDSNNDIAVLAPHESIIGGAQRRSFTSATIRPYPPTKRGDKVYFVGAAARKQGKYAALFSSAVVISQRGAQRDLRLFTVDTGMLGHAQRVRPGASGGPVIDEAGRVVGIMAGVPPPGAWKRQSRLSDIGYVLSGALIGMIASAEGVSIKVSTGTAGSAPERTLMKIAKRYTVRVLCTPGGSEPMSR